MRACLGYFTSGADHSTIPVIILPQHLCLVIDFWRSVCCDEAGADHERSRTIGISSREISTKYQIDLLNVYIGSRIASKINLINLPLNYIKLTGTRWQIGCVGSESCAERA